VTDKRGWGKTVLGWFVVDPDTGPVPLAAAAQDPERIIGAALADN
jgi:hypothetical protein